MGTYCVGFILMYLVHVLCLDRCIMQCALPRILWCGCEERIWSRHYVLVYTIYQVCMHCVNIPTCTNSTRVDQARNS